VLVAVPPRVSPLRLESRPGRIAVIDAGGFLLGVVLLVAARLVPQLISPLAFWMLFAALACAFGVDFLLWLTRGVHGIELNGDVLTLRCGRSRAVRRLERASVRSVRLHRGWGGRMIELKVSEHGRPAAHWVRRLLNRSRVVLRDDAFDRGTFGDIAQRLAAWGE
jgi:hypothetical protein